MPETIANLPLLETLAYAIEAGSSAKPGYLDCVLHGVAALAGAMDIAPSHAEALRAAALLHNIGRLSVPEHILHADDGLTDDDEAKRQAHSVVAERLLSSIPFSQPVAAWVRSHTEYWDGTGFPDGLTGSAIPLESRILALAAAYAALRHPGRFHASLSPDDAREEIRALAGAQFDPALVSPFLHAASAFDKEALAAPSSCLTEETRLALEAIASAQRETMSIHTLTEATVRSLHLEAVADTLLAHTRTALPFATCVLFLPEDDGEYLRAVAANGTNARHLLGSLARVGTYFTGRAFSRGEVMQTTFLNNDLMLRDVSDAWTPFRSTLIVPLRSEGFPIGTLNLYAEEPNAFGPDALRVLRRIAALGGRALDNARRFAAVQETAYTDALTGLRNARYLREFLDREINRAHREQIPLAVLNIDLDNFKPINDAFGHARGDQTLREVADILSDHIRSYDLAARYAGDEFVVILSRTGRVPAETVAHKLKSAVEAHGRKLTAAEPGFPQLGISIGVALYPDDAQDLQGLLCRSDAAMYTDKQGRRAGRSSSGDGRQAA